MILKEVSVDGFWTENERAVLNVQNWSSRLNVSGHQSYINELNIEYWILSFEYWIWILNIEFEYWILVLNLNIEFEYWIWMLNLNVEYWMWNLNVTGDESDLKGSGSIFRLQTSGVFGSADVLMMMGWGQVILVVADYCAQRMVGQ